MSKDNSFGAPNNSAYAALLVWVRSSKMNWKKKAIKSLDWVAYQRPLATVQVPHSGWLRRRQVSSLPATPGVLSASQSDHVPRVRAQSCHLRRLEPTRDDVLRQRWRRPQCHVAEAGPGGQYPRHGLLPPADTRHLLLRGPHLHLVTQHAGSHVTSGHSTRR